MPVPLPGPNVVQYIIFQGVEYRRVYSADGVTAEDQVVDATIAATPEYATYHTSEEAVPIATDDANYVSDATADQGGSDDGQ